MSSSDRFFVNSSETLRTVDAHQELLASLDRITTYNPPVHTCSTGWKFQGFYSGPTSVAYLFYRLSQIFPDLEFKQQSLFDWAEAYLALSPRVQKAPDCRHYGIADETFARWALTAVMERDLNQVRHICQYEPVINAEDNRDGSDEWLYGRAGYLYLLRLCRTFVDAEAATSGVATLLRSAIENTVARILASPQPWAWHGKRCLGAAHGAAGILCQLVLSRPSAAPRLHGPLARLLDAQLASGNFPPSAGSASDALVQFCHGAPGVRVALRSLAPHFPVLKHTVDEAAARAAEDVWRRGVLTKTPCLCHGVAGNALALDADEARFLQFLSFMGTEAMEKGGWLRDAGRGDEFVGLFTGEAGRAWAWAVAAGRGERVVIGFNDL
ncbi:hypothetical protein F4804DRAFT_348640 [Jackrogersella minutella]|nr:hypothetical protein F4804DRAFT_348640 [Jackrogersella minutella]